MYWELLQPPGTAPERHTGSEETSRRVNRMRVRMENGTGWERGLVDLGPAREKNRGLDS